MVQAGQGQELRRKIMPGCALPESSHCGGEPPLTPDLSHQELRQDSKETGQRCLGLSHKIAKKDDNKQHI